MRHAPGLPLGVATLVAVGVLAVAMSFTAVAAARGRGCAGARTHDRSGRRADLQRAVVCLINAERHSAGCRGWARTRV